MEAALPSEAETIVLKEVAPFIFGDCQVQKIQKRQFFDVFHTEGDCNWFEAKVEMITVDGDKETRKAVNILVSGDTIHDALSWLKIQLNSYDCNILSIKQSPILELLKIEVPAE